MRCGDLCPFPPFWLSCVCVCVFFFPHGNEVFLTNRGLVFRWNVFFFVLRMIFGFLGGLLCLAAGAVQSWLFFYLHVRVPVLQ